MCTGCMVRVITQGSYTVSVYKEVGGQHHEPHCHVYWPDGSCVISLVDLHVLRGRATTTAREIVAMHWGEITAAWVRLNS